MTIEHKAWVKEVFDRAAPTYGRNACVYFDVFGKELVSLANLKPGEHILDVATGTGAILFPAAQQVGGQGSVIGIDISPNMIEHCKQRNNYPWVQLLVMDAENLDFPQHTFDVVFCGFSLFFLPNLKQALSEFKRVLKPSGRLAISLWGKPSFLAQWVVEHAKNLGADKQLKTCSIDSPEKIEKILKESGFTEITINEKNASFSHETAEAWWNSLWSHAFRSILEQLSPEKLEVLHQEAIKHFNSLNKQGTVYESMHAIHVIAAVSNPNAPL